MRPQTDIQCVWRTCSRCANPAFLLFPCTVYVSMSYSLISTCSVRYKLKILVRNQILCKSGAVVLRLKMHGNSPRPNSPFSAHSGRSLQICNQWGCQESHRKTGHRPFPAPYPMDRVSFKKLTGLWVTLKRQKSPGTSPDKFSQQHYMELRVCFLSARTGGVRLLQSTV